MKLKLSMRRPWRTDLANRTFTQELLETATPETAVRNLREIARINRWFGGHAALIRMMRNLVHTQERFSVLDVGAASGDMGRCLIRHFPNAQVMSLDRHAAHLRDATSLRVVADALRLPFQPRAFDFVLCSSFLHHFRDDEVIEMIGALRPFAHRAAPPGSRATPSGLLFYPADPALSEMVAINVARRPSVGGIGFPA